MSEPVGNSPRGDIPGNSHRSRVPGPTSVPAEPAEPVTQIIHGKVVRHKAPVHKRIARSLFASDIQDVGQFTLTDILVPAFKNMLFDVISKGSARALFGERGMVRAGTVGPVSTIKAKYSQMQEGTTVRELSPRDRATHTFDAVSLETRAEAVEAIEYLKGRIAKYGSTSVSDLYALLGVTSSFVDQRYGWTNLDTAATEQRRDGWLLALPQPVQLH
jgi:hypothetical protein